MREETRTITIDNRQCRVQLLCFEPTDRGRIRELYNAWRTLTDGMHAFGSRGVNIPEGLSEAAFCLEYNSARVIKVYGPASGSFDTIDLQNFKRQQIKATSVAEDLTSFGPRSVWDDLYWLDFFRDGLFDGRFDVYRIPNDLIYNFRQNATENFRDQQEQGRRPRLRMRQDVIIPNNLQPIGTHTI
ncbi:Bsp6I family restriction endonuclease [bacterium]|nr:MAG: Bsp6I family restriction endonuclease [bacterium]